MAITPHDFQRMVGLWFYGALISLEGESGTQLGLELLGRRYAIETIHYTDLKADFLRRSQVMTISIPPWTRLAGGLCTS